MRSGMDVTWLAKIETKKRMHSGMRVVRAWTTDALEKLMLSGMDIAMVWAWKHGKANAVGIPSGRWIRSHREQSLFLGQAPSGMDVFLAQCMDGLGNMCPGMQRCYRGHGCSG